MESVRFLELEVGLLDFRIYLPLLHIQYSSNMVYIEYSDVF